MPDYGHAALMKEVETGKPDAPRLLSFEDPPSDLTGYAFCISYCDYEGNESVRWVTFESFECSEDKISAYCWVRKAFRTFRTDRIEEVMDGNGEVRSSEDFDTLLLLDHWRNTDTCDEDDPEFADIKPRKKENPEPTRGEMIGGYAFLAAVAAFIVWLII